MKPDPSVTDLVRAVVKGVITPRTAIRQLEAREKTVYQNGMLAEAKQRELEQEFDALKQKVVVRGESKDINEFITEEAHET